MKTAEEFLIQKYTKIYETLSEEHNQVISLEMFLNLYVHGKVNGIHENSIDFMIEFAKLHVKAALKTASEKASVYADEGGYSEFVDEHSILNSYPESNIK